ncbi:MAG: hypothetical protein WC861_05590 [Candidatus Micrarchaeia archaeon]|jgi:hypothetical protein
MVNDFDLMGSPSKRKESQYIQQVKQMNRDDIEKLERVSEAEVNRFDAEARKWNAEAQREAQLKFRILFERAPEEALAFSIYCLTFGALIAYTLPKILELTDKMMYAAALIVLVIVCVLPIFILPKIPLIGWLRDLSKKNEAGRTEPEKAPKIE